MGMNSKAWSFTKARWQANKFFEGSSDLFVELIAGGLSGAKEIMEEKAKQFAGVTITDVKGDPFQVTFSVSSQGYLYDGWKMYMDRDGKPKCGRGVGLPSWLSD